MAEKIDQLAQPVRIFLVDTAQDYDKFLPLLEKLVEEHSVSDVSVCETNRGTWLKEGFGSSFNLRSEDEIEI